MRIRPRRPKKEEESAPWLATFNDLMTNLMVFFVLVFSLSGGDMRKLKDFSGSFQSGLGVLYQGDRLGVKVMQPRYQEDGGGEEGEAALPEEARPGPLDMGAQLGFEVKDPHAQRNLEALNLLKGISATQEDDRTVIVLQDSVLFPSGSADILAASLPVFEKLLRVLLTRPCQIRVEGHTDNIPISTARFPSNWELSVARAVNVAKYLIEKGGISPDRFCAVGYGETRPIVPNDTPVNRQKNRRVELVLTPIQGE